MNDYENFEKGMIYMKILRKRGWVVEKRGGGGNEMHAPCSCGLYMCKRCRYTQKLYINVLRKFIQFMSASVPLTHAWTSEKKHLIL
jgi:hypothetical protein